MFYCKLMFFPWWFPVVWSVTVCYYLSGPADALARCVLWSSARNLVSYLRDWPTYASWKACSLAHQPGLPWLLCFHCSKACLENEIEAGYHLVGRFLNHDFCESSWTLYYGWLFVEFIVNSGSCEGMTCSWMCFLYNNILILLKYGHFLRK